MTYKETIKQLNKELKHKTEFCVKLGKALVEKQREIDRLKQKLGEIHETKKI